MDQSPGQEGTDATVINQAMRGKADDMIKWGLVSEDIILEMGHDLRGDVYDEEKRKWKSTDDDLMRLCNEYCINKMSSIVRFRVGKNTYLSNIDKEEMNRILYYLGVDVATLIYCEFEKLGLKEQDMDIVLFGVMDLCEFAIRRAIGEGERKFIQTVRAVIEKVTGGDEKKDEGFKFPTFFGRRGAS